MEFEFNVNNLIGSEISKFDNRLTPARNSPGTSNEFRNQLLQVVDALGEASAKAQNLRGPITTGRKMTYSDHVLYIMKDSHSGSGKGSAVGFLKLGTKKLFVYDSQGVHHEMDPMCVLDFYVHESRQRMGCGHKLFEYMLQDQNIKPAHLAIDRPSHKFSQFLIKYYHLKATIPQVNNFVIFNGFFNDRNSGTSSTHKNAAGRPPVHPYRKANQNGFSDLLAQQSEADQNGFQERNGIESTTTTDMPSKPLLGSENGVLHKPPDTDSGLFGRHMLNPTPPLPDIGQTHDSRLNSNRKVPSPPLRRNGQGHPVDYTNMFNTHQDAYDRFGHLKTSPLQPDMKNRNKTAPLAIRHEPRTVTNDPHIKTNGEGYAGNNTRDMGILMQKIGRTDDSDVKNNHKPAAIESMKTQTNSNSDMLLPKNFTPYKELSLPPSDPYSSRISAKRLSTTGWNLFGNPQEQRSYSAADRFKNTRPW